MDNVPLATNTVRTKVMKFGGSSLKDTERIVSVANIVKQAALDACGKRACGVLVVLSAMGKTTDMILRAQQESLDTFAVPRRLDASQQQQGMKDLMEYHTSIAKELHIFNDVENDLMSLFDQMSNLLRGITYLGEVTTRTKDLLVSFGERLAVRIFAAYLTSVGLVSRPVDAWDAGMLTLTPPNCEMGYGRPIVEFAPTNDSNLAAYFKDVLTKKSLWTPIVTGFIAKDISGRVTTLGRNGSDLTATILGAALEVDEIEIWTDVDGVMTADPRSVPEAKNLRVLLFNEISELASSGAKILHPLSISPAMEKDAPIPIRIKNTYEPTHPGTLILDEYPEGWTRPLLTAITSKKHVTTVSVTTNKMLQNYGFLSRTFAVFERLMLSVNVIATSEISVSMSLDVALTPEGTSDLMKQLRDVKTQLGDVEILISNCQGIITLIGDSSRVTEILYIMTKCIHECSVHIWMLSATEATITTIVNDRDVERLVRALHREFFE